MFEELKFRVNYYLMDIEMWWDDIWMSNKEKNEIKESLRKRRESGGCSMWREYLKGHPEAAKHNWEKNFIKHTKHDRSNS